MDGAISATAEIRRLPTITRLISVDTKVQWTATFILSPIKDIYVEDLYELGFFKSIKVQWKSRMCEFELVCNYVPIAWQIKAGHELNNEEFCIV